MNENDDFASIFRFLESSAEVTGREALVVTAEMQKKLAKLASGQCNDEERRKLLSLLEQQPNLVPVLADEIKKLRASSKC